MLLTGAIARLFIPFVATVACVWIFDEANSGINYAPALSRWIRHATNLNFKVTTIWRFFCLFASTSLWIKNLVRWTINHSTFLCIILRLATACKSIPRDTVRAFYLTRTFLVGYFSLRLAIARRFIPRKATIARVGTFILLDRLVSDATTLRRDRLSTNLHLKWTAIWGFLCLFASTSLLIENLVRFTFSLGTLLCIIF